MRLETKETSFRLCQGGPLGVLPGHLADDLQRVGTPPRPHEGERGHAAGRAGHRSQAGRGKGAAGLLVSYHLWGRPARGRAGNEEHGAAPGAVSSLPPCGI